MIPQESLLMIGYEVILAAFTLPNHIEVCDEAWSSNGAKNLHLLCLPLSKGRFVIHILLMQPCLMLFAL